ncbi:hypothetical protein PRIPAC_97631, partial [Pristionchus pacificus]|uniref:Uncharacterized protein n=1 Tax=Pristionchus pacificus TaxID=54126 RepID=A0A2A6D1T5_PRIPA
MNSKNLFFFNLGVQQARAVLLAQFNEERELMQAMSQQPQSQPASGSTSCPYSK